jgi:hypothetical protein
VPSTAPADSGVRQARRGRWARRLATAALIVFIGLGASGMLGVRTGTAAASSGGFDLSVTYARMTRPGLATPWSVEVRRPGGFDGPVTIATTGAYFDLFDENGIDPEPSSSTSQNDLLLWEFEPPVGDVLTVSFDARLEPAVQQGRSAETSVLVDGRPVVTVKYSTRVMP